MKKNILICVSFIMSLALLVSCGNNTPKNSVNNSKSENSTSNPFDMDTENATTEANFGFGPVNEYKELTYNGGAIEQEYFYDNVGDVDCKLGFMIFVDGVAQSYKIVNQTDYDIIHEQNVEKKHKIKFKVSFTPNIGKKGDTLGYYIATIFNPTYIPSPNSPGFGNNHRLSQVMPVDLKYTTTAASSEPSMYDKYSTENVSDEVKKEFLSTDKDDKQKFKPNDSSLFHLKYNDNYKDPKIEIKKASKLSLELDGLCGPDDGKYRTTIFIDNKPVKTTDGKASLYMELKKGMMSKQQFDIDISGLTGTHVLTAISVPIGNDYTKLTNSIVDSYAKLLVIGD